MKLLNVHLQAIVRKKGILFTSILQNNIDKLLVRFEKGFSKESANNRDLKKELKKLKKWLK